MEMPPLRLVLPVRKENPGGTGRSLQNCGALSRCQYLLQSHTVERAGKSMGLNRWECDYNGEGGVACNNQHIDLGRLSSYLQCLSNNPNLRFCSSAKPSWGHIMIRELNRVQVYFICILKQGVLPAIDSSLPTSRQGTESQPHLLWRVSSGPN